jgi:transcriptional regulator with XRE-family HTH domain
MQRQVAQFSKFSPFMVALKKRLRDQRLKHGLKMADAAKLLGLSNKQLEDVETSRNYGCHVEAELLQKARIVYRTSIEFLMGADHMDPESPYYARPRAKGGYKPRAKS